MTFLSMPALLASTILRHCGTGLTMAGGLAACMTTHLFCCGLLPSVTGFSLQAVTGVAGADPLLSGLMIVASAVAVTGWEKRRHTRQCHAEMCHDTGHKTRMRVALLRNLVAGFAGFGLFHYVLDMQALHGVLESLHLHEHDHSHTPLHTHGI